MSDRKLKVGVIGVGALGRHHARLYKECKNAEVVGIYDANQETAKKVADEFGFKTFSSINELAQNCEGLSIAVPATLHHQIAIPLLKKKKHLLIEKPLASTVEEAGEIVRLAEKNKLVVEVGHTERYNPVMNYLDNKILNPTFIEARRLAPYPPPRPGLYPRGTEVGVVLDLMIHDLELILHIVKSKVEKVEAAGFPVLSHSEDIASARITFKNGTIANIVASRISETPLRRMHIYQPDSYMILDYQEKSGFLYSKGATGLTKETVPVVDHNALQVELENFVKNTLIATVSGKIPELKVSGKKGLEALRLAIKITEEIKKHNDKYSIANMPDSLKTF